MLSLASLLKWEATQLLTGLVAPRWPSYHITYFYSHFYISRPIRHIVKYYFLAFFIDIITSQYYHYSKVGYYFTIHILVDEWFSVAYCSIMTARLKKPVLRYGHRIDHHRMLNAMSKISEIHIYGGILVKMKYCSRWSKWFRSENLMRRKPKFLEIVILCY